MTEDEQELADVQPCTDCAHSRWMHLSPPATGFPVCLSGGLRPLNPCVCTGHTA